MKHNEIVDLFWDKFNSCYKVKLDCQPDIIYYFYDESYARKKKLCKISNKPITSPNEVTGVCLFEQNKRNKTLHIDLEGTKICDVFKYSDDIKYVDMTISSILRCSDIFYKYSSYYTISSDYYFKKYYNELIIL